MSNLREIAPTVYFNIPVAWEMLAEALETDDRLAQTFYSRVKLFFCAGAGLSQAAWEHLDAVALRRCGESIRIMTGLGMTETSPSCTFGTGPFSKAGYVGVPAPGCKVKLVPMGGKLEARFHGPHVTPGYWRAPHLTSAAFDADGYYCTGDALRFVDEAHPEWGFMFDGRIAEDFKLSTGTFVSVGPLRARVISQGAPYVQDAVVTGLDRHAIGLLVFPRLDNCLALSGLRAGDGGGRGTGQRPGARLLPAPARHAERRTPAAPRPGSNACCCWPSRRRSTRASRPTRVRSTRRRCSRGARPWSMRCTTERNHNTILAA